MLVNRGVTNTSRGVDGKWPYWQTADLAPSCLDVPFYANGSYQAPALGSSYPQNWNFLYTGKTLTQNVNGSVVPLMTDSAWCLEPPQPGNNAVPRCF